MTGWRLASGYNNHPAGEFDFHEREIPVTFENMLHFKFKQLRVGKYRAVATVNMIFTVDN